MLRNVLMAGLVMGVLAGCHASVAPMAAPVRTQPVVGAQSLTGVRNGLNTMVENLFRAGDVNQDGFLSGEELLKARNSVQFPLVDADQDGRVSRAEFLASYRAVELKQIAKVRNDMKEAFRKADANNDGFLWPAEFQASLGTWNLFSMTMRDFRLADRNFDGRLTLSEYEDLYIWVIATAFEEAPAPQR